MEKNITTIKQTFYQDFLCGIPLTKINIQNEFKSSSRQSSLGKRKTKEITTVNQKIGPSHKKPMTALSKHI